MKVERWAKLTGASHVYQLWFVNTYINVNVFKHWIKLPFLMLYAMFNVISEDKKGDFPVSFSVTVATRVGQSAACASRTGRLSKGRTEGQTAGETGKGRRRCVCVWAKKLTICGLHDTGLMVVAPGNASHRGHLGPLRVARGALRQPRHIGGCWVVICGEWGVWGLNIFLMCFQIS